jgi:S-formylglutathione hydrolase FrmB
MRERNLLLALILFLSLYANGQSATSARVATARVEAVKFESKLVGASLPYNVVLPPYYDDATSKEIRYPVLYLLHGLSGSANDWVSNKAHLADYAAQYRIIIVTPEGHDGWYTDSGTVPTDKYESYILQELIPDVERRFRTIAAREGRAIAGLSMGGYGALKFGLKFPDRFIFAASMSGALIGPILDPADQQLPSYVRPSISRAYGAMDNPVRSPNDIFKLINEIPSGSISTLPFLYLDCGTEDGLVTSNRAFDDVLLKHKVPHEFRELPGTHNWPYWDQQVQEILRIASRKMTHPRDGTAAVK